MLPAFNGNDIPVGFSNSLLHEPAVRIAFFVLNVPLVVVTVTILLSSGDTFETLQLSIISPPFLETKNYIYDRCDDKNDGNSL